MTKEELQIKLTELLPTATFEEGGEWVNILIEPTDWLAFATSLRNDAALNFDYLFCLTCIDFKTHLTMVYHLESTVHRHIIVVKAKLDITAPAIETAAGIWKTADFHEREVYELFGVDFINHPDLRLLILPDGWEGKNPLRKDYEDAVNMIRL
jgi:NADH-quinone oxidoreductase subunit C